MILGNYWWMGHLPNSSLPNWQVVVKSHLPIEILTCIGRLAGASVSACNCLVLSGFGCNIYDTPTFFLLWHLFRCGITLGSALWGIIPIIIIAIILRFITIIVIVTMIRVHLHDHLFKAIQAIITRLFGFFPSRGTFTLVNTVLSRVFARNATIL